MRLIIKDVRDQGREIRSLEMLPEGANGHHELSFTPGQVAILQAGDELPPAYFAFASAPEDAALQFLVKRGGAAAERLYGMTPGQALELERVVGRGFPLEEHSGRDLIFIAMGTGVAPLRSALRSALQRPERFGRLLVLYGARTPDQFCYREEVEDWRASGVEVRQVVSQPVGYEWAGPTGYVQSLLDNLLPDLASPVALVCGSREMIEQTRERLRAMGLGDEQILTNY